MFSQTASLVTYLYLQKIYKNTYINETATRIERQNLFSTKLTSTHFVLVNLTRKFDTKMKNQSAEDQVASIHDTK